jgi:aminoglycoside phosphotransferase (APT) family kinase protein
VDDDLADRLGAVLGARVTDVARLTGGASRETSSCTAVFADGTARPLIVQRQRAGGQGGMAREGALLRAAHAAGVPVAEVLAASDDPADLGGPYLVAERIDGETIARKILRDDEYAPARTRLVAQWGDALARIHAIAPADAPGLAIEDRFTKYRDLMDGFGEPHPAFELAFRWLDAHRPPPLPPVVLHGDFRLGNVIVGPEGLRAVLDWEIAHLGDPAEDLAWLCVRAWRFGAPGPVGGVGERADLLAAYRAAGGIEIDPDRLRWWEVLGSVTWGVMCQLQARAHLDGWTRSHELAAIGRRVCENEHDVLELLP